MREKRICPNCQQSVESDDVFCIYCGTKLTSTASDKPDASNLYIGRCPNGHLIDDYENSYCPVCGLPLDKKNGAEKNISLPYENNYWRCEVCGNNNSSEFKFCTYCGKPVNIIQNNQIPILNSPSEEDLLRKRTAKSRWEKNANSMPYVQQHADQRPPKKELEAPVKNDLMPKRTGKNKKQQQQEMPPVYAPVVDYEWMVNLRHKSEDCMTEKNSEE